MDNEDTIKDRQCSAKGCTRELHGRGLCLMHLKRIYRNGHIERIRPERIVVNHQVGNYWFLDVGHGQYTVIEGADYDKVKHIKWHRGPNGYVHGYDSKTRKQVLLHRYILDCGKGMESDHKMGRQLDNRRSQLRVCTHSQNRANTRPNKGKRYKGVRWMHANKKWGAFIMCKGVDYYLGSSSDPRECAMMYNEAAVRLFGEFARLNVV